MITIIFNQYCCHKYKQQCKRALHYKNIFMEYRLTNSIGNLTAEDLYNYHLNHRKSLVAKFLNWCIEQENNRFLWLALTFFAQIDLTLPLTAVCIVFFGGNNYFLWIIMVAVNVPVLVTNLAALPTKATLPLLFFGWLTQLNIIFYCIVYALLH